MNPHSSREAGVIRSTWVTETTGITVTCTAASAGGTATRSVTIKLDSTRPTVRCFRADGLWHASDVEVPCSASDAASGLARPSEDAAFTLTASISSGVETADAWTNVRYIADNAGNLATAGSIHGNKIDKKPPSISIASPVAMAYLLTRQYPQTMPARTAAPAWLPARAPSPAARTSIRLRPA